MTESEAGNFSHDQPLAGSRTCSREKGTDDIGRVKSRGKTDLLVLDI